MTIKPGTATSTAVHCTADLLQISLCKSQPTAGRLPLPLSNLYLHTARVGLWTDRLEVATVDLRFFVCRFVSRWVMYDMSDEFRPSRFSLFFVSSLPDSTVALHTTAVAF